MGAQSYHTGMTVATNLVEVEWGSNIAWSAVALHRTIVIVCRVVDLSDLLCFILVF